MDESSLFFAYLARSHVKWRPKGGKRRDDDWEDSDEEKGKGKGDKEGGKAGKEGGKAGKGGSGKKKDLEFKETVNILFTYLITSYIYLTNINS